jgi:sulfur carrier protein
MSGHRTTYTIKTINIMSKIKVNGNIQEIGLPVSLLDIIKLNNVVQPDMVSVQLNGEFVLRDDYETTALKENDEIDFLYFMGGGAL